jgi:CheY-like chemotaxis protein
LHPIANVACLGGTLRQRGYVTVMRHANSARPPPDRALTNSDDVERERQLDEMGRASAPWGMQEQRPDLIITDYAMPGRSGLDLCRQLRSHGHTRHIPIVLHTGTDLPHTETALVQLARRVRPLLAASKDVQP